MKNDVVVATDLDGTYFYPKKRLRLIAGPNYRLSQKIIENGGRLLFVTSRNRFVLTKLKNKLKSDNFDLVACNGAVIIRGGKIIRDISFESDTLRKIIEHIDKVYNPSLLPLSSRSKNIVFRRRFLTFMFDIYNFWQHALGEPFERDNDVFWDQVANGNVYKGMIFVGVGKKRREKARIMTEELAKAFPEAEWSWSDEVIEFTPKGCSKSIGLHFYLEYSGISPDNVLVVGDSGNDISMFDDFYEGSYCMSHAAKTVSSHAKHIIDKWSDIEEALYPSADSKTPEESREDKHEPNQ